MLDKIKEKYHDGGIKNIFKTIGNVIKWQLRRLLNFIKKIYFLAINNEEKKISKLLLNSKYKRVVIFENHFGWSTILFQRPQHIALNLASSDTLFIYSSSHEADYNSNEKIKKINNNLYIVCTDIYKHTIIKNLKKRNIHKYLMIYSTENVSLREVKYYKKHNFKIIYDYVDEINPSLINKKYINNILEKHKYVIKNNEIIVTTATELYDDVLSINKNANVILISNGVDYNHFSNLEKQVKLDDNYSKILKSKKLIIGYYGALASWFDYDLVEYIAKSMPHCQIVLFGIKFDGTYDNSNLNKYDNIYFGGKIDYDVLPYYATHFDICFIPFILNDITKSTSPVKLFEYMALSKPIVTTDMKECRKYKSVLIGKNKQDFINQIEKSIKIIKSKDKKYYNLLMEDALNNTWSNKGNQLRNYLNEFEKGGNKNEK